MLNRDIADGFGCSLRLLVIVLVSIMLMGTLYQLFQLISDVGPREYIPASAIAAQRCRDKFSEFKNNDYIRQITLTEIEINSAIQEDIQQGIAPFANTWIKLERDQFTLWGIWDVIDLSLPEKEVSSLELKTKGGSLWHLRMRFEISGELEVGEGQLKIVSAQIALGRFELPGFMVSFLQRVRPGLFAYSILPQIKHVWLKNGEIEVIK